MALAEFGLSGGEDIPKLIGQIKARIEKTKQKIVAANTSEDPITEVTIYLLNILSFPLLASQ